MNNLLARLNRTSLLPLLLFISFLPLVLLSGYLAFTAYQKDILGVTAVGAQSKKDGGSNACKLGSPDDPKWAKLNEYDQFFAAAADEFKFDDNAANILKAMSMIESGGQGHYRDDGSIIEGCDRYGQGCAIGVMQIKPQIWNSVAREIGADLEDPEGNIRTAAKLMLNFTNETGSWETAISERYHPGVGQYGLKQDEYVNLVKEIVVELGAADCADTSGDSDGSTSSGSSTDESGCVITKVGDPRVSPTIPPSCGAVAGDYHNPLARPNELDQLNQIVTGIATEMGSYGGQFAYGGHVEHAGLDIGTRGAARSPVFAVTDGVVTSLVAHDGPGSCEGSSSGCTLRLEHTTDKYTSEYVHVDTQLRIGQRVRRGEPIGTVHVWPTATGYNDHLHFELRLTENRYNINPRIHFPEFEQFPLSGDYFGDVRRHSASRGIFLEDSGGTWPEKFRDHPPCADKTPGWCWAM